MLTCLLYAHLSTYIYMNVGVCVWLIGTLFVNQWKRPAGQDKDVKHKIFKVSKDSSIFRDYYNDVQCYLKSLAGMDDFLTGNISTQMKFMKTFI